jgi:peptidyl-tRNA hydrolase
MRIKILVRRNLKMSDRKMSAQCVHAALGLRDKFPQHRHWACVVLDASDNKFEEAKIAHPEAYVVTDAGLTEVPAGSETAIAWYEDAPTKSDAS